MTSPAIEPYIRAAQHRNRLSQVSHYVLERDLPDPPENPQFLELPEAAQELYATRFARGIHTTEQADNMANARARSAWHGWVARCRANRKREHEAAAKEAKLRTEILEQNRRHLR